VRSHQSAAQRSGDDEYSVYFFDGERRENRCARGNEFGGGRLFDEAGGQGGIASSGARAACACGAAWKTRVSAGLHFARAVDEAGAFAARGGSAAMGGAGENEWRY